VSTGTAVVVRTDVKERTQVTGVLGYTGSYAVTASAAGTVTAEPAVGAVITQGSELYELDGRPVWLLYGSRPVWRSFQAGISDGPDVRQLERDLVILGFDPARSMTVDDHFTSSTSAAIRRWQRAHQVPATGALALGGVAFLPGPLRVNAVAVPVGGQAAPGQPVIAGSSVDRAVTLAVTTAQSPLVHVHDQVAVTLPDGVTSPGTVTVVGPVTYPSAQNGGNGSQQNQQGQQSQSGPAQASVSVTIELANVAAGAGLDQAPVQVDITDAVHPNVLAAPISALLATPGGGYAVIVVRGSARTTVAVRVGLFDDASQLVEVGSTHLSAGDRVEVPTG